MGGLAMRREFIKPSMMDLEGEKGKEVINYLKQSKVYSDVNVRRKSLEYKKHILDARGKKK